MRCVFAPEWDRERKRLAGIEAAADAKIPVPGCPSGTGTFASHGEPSRGLYVANLINSDVLSRLGVGPGWRCAEVGAGAGSLAQWLAGQVGDTGQVVATALDPGHLIVVEGPNR
jgi:hypothetical protein